MAEDDGQDRDDAAAEAFEAMRGELALLRRAVEGLAAERGRQDAPDYTETLGQLQQGMEAAMSGIDHVAHILAKAPAFGITPEDMAQRIAVASSAARAQDHAALARAGEDKARILADLRTIAGASLTHRQQRRRQQRFGLIGLAIGGLLWAIVPGLIAREIAPASWQLPERMATRALDLPRWEAARRLAETGKPEIWNAMVADGTIVQANREAIEQCREAAARAKKAVRCTIRIAPAP